MINMGRMNIFFIFSIDIGYLLHDINSKERLQSLRATDEILEKFQRVFLKSTCVCRRFLRAQYQKKTR